MTPKTVTREKTECTDSQFWNAVDIWSRNPHVANRRILKSIEILTVAITTSSVADILLKIESLNFPCMLLTDSESEESDKIGATRLKSFLCTNVIDSPSTSDDQTEKIDLRVAKLLPRSAQIFSPAIQFTFMERIRAGVGRNCVTIIERSLLAGKRSLGAGRTYMIQQDYEGYTSLSVNVDSTLTSDPSIEWLERKWFPRLLGWMRNETGNVRTTLPSLSLVSGEKYAKLYGQLKEKYGKEMVSIWPENTDPMKFVYEDVAIATYLLLLWEEERLERGTEKLQSFLDLGCGNGLLVHILFSEGHQGTGIDLRKRKIWDMFPSGTPLKVDTIVPSSTTVYPGVDWIIGNHSDELTPWIPVIAARSSTDCRFFLLPCCAYEFDGTKYQRQCSSKSQYSEYIDYVKAICDECGFETRMDRLRIPSTKRICLIGTERKAECTEYEREALIQGMIRGKALLASSKNGVPVANDVEHGADESAWCCSFKSRDTVERVRNCTQLDKALIADIVSIVAKQLLREGCMISLEEMPGKRWNAGRRLCLSEIVESIPQEMLRRLRNECGGLQTLLKNHSDVFDVSQGRVHFRMPGRHRTFRKAKKNKFAMLRTKVKPCWFYQNHPDGCPATEIKCNFKH